MNNFDIFGQIGKELEEFEERIVITTTKENTGNRYLNKKQKGYNFNQKETLNLIDLYYNSKFETGEIDNEGHRKLFLNVCAFRADVASKMIDIDTKDFVFVPESKSFKWTAYFIQREFEQWMKDEYFGELINEFVEMFPKYGTIVSKRVGDDIQRVVLKNIVCKQNAKSLKDSPYVIEIHPDMTFDDMKKYKDWNLEGLNLEFGKTTTVYERYGAVPTNYYNQLKGINTKVPDYETTECVIIATCDKLDNKDEYAGTLLFIEEMDKDDRPYEECHWKKQDGRWLGIGEIENQFENQIARNMIANLRRRALLWSSKKIFQSPDDTLAKNLIRDVKDGEVLRIMPNGNITQVDSASRNMGEFSSTETIWEDNSNQKSFTYEVATGESMPSGTPFRMGVVLSNAVNSHFGLKKEKLGLFLKKVVFEQVFEIFKKENKKEHNVLVFAGEEGMQDLKNVCIEIEMNKAIDEWLMGNKPMLDFEALRKGIEETITAQDIIEVIIPEKIYDEAKVKIKLSITGEELNVDTKITTYTTLYQALSAKGDPRAEQVLEKLMALTGDNLETIAGKTKQTTPSMNEMAMANAPQTQPAL